MGVSSDSNENPWESASNDNAYKASQHQRRHEQSSGEVPQEAATTSARLNWHEEDRGNSNTARSSMDINDNRHDHRNRDSNNSHSSFINFIRKCWNNFSIQDILNTLDATVTLLLLVFVGYNLHYQDNTDRDHHESPEKVVILMISTIVSILIVWRTLLLSCLFPSKRCSKSCSTNLTLILCGSYTILALIAWIVLNKHSGSAVPWCWSLGKWCASAPKTVPICLTVLALVEGMRFIFAQGRLAQFDQDHPQASTTTSDSRHPDESFTTPRRNRPWWWNRRQGDDNDMRESLLGNNGQPGWTASGGQSYLMDDGVGTPSSRSFLRGWFGGRRGNDASNPRDDGSVDYASLNEEWASRSEEDPYWWTREENNNNNNNQV
jgi:hypothetical protein